jgi:hypothetical protein
VPGTVGATAVNKPEKTKQNKTPKPALKEGEKPINNRPGKHIVCQRMRCAIERHKSGKEEGTICERGCIINEVDP